MAAAPFVSVLIVSYEVRELLLECLDSVDRAAGVPIEVIVVDNASTDGSADAVAELHPEVKLLRMPRNVGFGRANNAGLEVAEGRFVLLLNPDVTLRPGAIGRLADLLLVRPEVGAVGPRIIRPDGRLDLAARRGFPTPAASFYRLVGLSRLFPGSPRFNRYHMGHQEEGEAQEIDAGMGACLLVRRSAIDRVGFFDPAYFMYGEDLDLCYRLKMGGWKIYYQPAAEAVHRKGASTRQRTGRMLLEFHRAMWTFHDKHFADDLPAFGNGLIWASIWARWSSLALRSVLTRDPRVSA